MLREASLNAIIDAVKLIGEGKLVSFPTETVYGLGANALDGKAVAQIFEAKGRPSFNPLIVHVAELDMAKEFAVFNEAAMNIAAKFWPGPLTLILPKTKDCPISDLCTAGLDTIAIRVPAHPVAQDLLRRAELPIAAPSANKSGEPSPTAPVHVQQSLGDKVDLILAGGKCTVGLESTVLDLSGDKPLILRPGAITLEHISSILPDVESYEVRASEEDAPKSPGQLVKHYAPNRPVRLNAVDIEEGEALLAFGSIRFMGIRSGGAASNLPDTQIRNLSESGDLHEAAANLFAFLRELDREEHSRIAVMNIPDKGIGLAINDRLSRAAAANSK